MGCDKMHRDFALHMFTRTFRKPFEDNLFCICRFTNVDASLIIVMMVIEGIFVVADYRLAK